MLLWGGLGFLAGFVVAFALGSAMQPRWRP